MLVDGEFEMPDLVGEDLAQPELRAVADQPFVGVDGAMSTASPTTCLDASGEATNFLAISTLPY